ncbi:MAG: hypothetical protein IJ100_07870 [Lachnospiraceae bacterium]|nr:hypothetical protein [Lachnospiraceae bacterium]
MTTLASTSKKCFVCGTVSQFSALQSTNSFGYSDLDFRPAEMKRSTMPYWIQECPGCGYVSSDISRPVPFIRYVRSLLQSDDYLNCGDIPFQTHLAQQFFRQFYLLFEEGRKEAALNAIMAAAWCCDDSGEKENAHKCRLLAVELIPATVSPDVDDDDELREQNALALIRADLLRRTGQFDEVIQTYTGAHYPADRAFDSMAKYEVELALLKDDSCHNIGEALERFPMPGFMYYSVVIEERKGRSYYYLPADGDEYAVGDMVIVPFGDIIMRGTVISAEEYAEEDVPFPLDDMKKIYGRYHAEVDHDAPDYEPQAAAMCSGLIGFFTSRNLKPEIHGPADEGYEWLAPGERCLYVPNPYENEPLRVRCGDDFTVMYREWRSCYEYPRVKDAVTPLDRARNEIARHNFKKLHEQLLDFVDRRLDVVMAYIGDDFIGGAFVNSTTTHRSLSEVLLNKVTSDPNIILRASKEGARLEMRSWQSLLDHTKVLEPRQTEA